MPEIPKAYNPQEVEDKIYKIWEKSGVFNPDNLDLPKNAKVFSVAMPPPNVTGILHLGHALENTLMDTMIRYQRMQGKKALLIPGTDHAAVATQAKVEKDLVKSGKYKNPRQELGREKLLEIIRDYSEKSKAMILSQIRKMGTSCDWDRLAYTFDEPRSRAVNEVFAKMYRDGLIYRGYRVVNWSVKGQSTCSDDELVHIERPAKLYTFKYSKDFPIPIATTRPETKLGDTAVAVHPEGKWKKYIGQKFTIDIGAAKPLQIKIIADKNVDSAFGTGALGVTPAHSMIDFEMAEKNKLPVIKVIGENGKMTAEAGKEYAGLTVDEAREKFVEYLKKEGLLEKEEDIVQNVGTSDRFGDVVDVLPMTQWFVDVNKKIPGSPKLGEASKKKSLKDLMREAVTIGHNGKIKQKIKITPDRFQKIYLNWIDNLRDWCISRQMWWGHRIPVWYKTEVGSEMEAIYFNENVIFQKLGFKNESEFNKFSWKINEENKDATWGSWKKGEIQIGRQYINLLKEKGLFDEDWVQKNRIKRNNKESERHVGEKPIETFGWIQDPDTLDTWFSSGLWTFSILGWPDRTKDFKDFHPTSWMQMGSEIIFFWMARMILMSTYTIDQIPFKDVYIHGILRDKDGRKFSKSLGNGIDPLEIIKKYGTDALRLSLIIGTTPGNDARFYEEKVEGYRNFANKLWNISRFILFNIDSADHNTDIKKIDKKKLTLADKWILARLSGLAGSVTKNLDKFNFSAAGEEITKFMWDDFADWYLEIAKIESKRGEAEKKSKDAILTHCLKTLLKLLHPFTPFVTEEIWSKFNETMLMTEKWPKFSFKAGKSDIADFSLIRNSIVAIRNLRSENKIEPGKKIKAIFAGKKTGLINREAGIIKKLSYLEDLVIELKKEKIEKVISAFIDGVEIHLPLEGLIDAEKELVRVEKEIKENEKKIAEAERNLANKNFIERAPKEIVADTREKLKNSYDAIKKLEEKKKTLMHQSLRY
ncbi:MAG: valine--tRNA ligase [bacterium]|nr:valine--tRNA ligase [bacterium]